jgi:hypothetical protein
VSGRQCSAAGDDYWGEYDVIGAALACSVVRDVLMLGRRGNCNIAFPSYILDLLRLERLIEPDGSYPSSAYSARDSRSFRTAFMEEHS